MVYVHHTTQPCWIAFATKIAPRSRIAHPNAARMHGDGAPELSGGPPTGGGKKGVSLCSTGANPTLPSLSRDQRGLPGGQQKDPPGASASTNHAPRDWPVERDLGYPDCGHQPTFSPRRQTNSLAQDILGALPLFLVTEGRVSRLDPASEVSASRQSRADVFLGFSPLVLSSAAPGLIASWPFAVISVYHAAPRRPYLRSPHCRRRRYRTQRRYKSGSAPCRNAPPADSRKAVP